MENFETVLVVDTATESCSAALKAQGQIYSRYEVAPQRHANLILEMCDSLLSEAKIERRDIDAIGFGAGPGSFTGVRIAASVAQGLGLGLDRKVFGVSDLLAMAIERGQDIHEPYYGLASIDARMGEVYFALFRFDSLNEQGQRKYEVVISDQVAKPEDAISQIAQHLQAGTVVLSGTGIRILMGCGLYEHLSSIKLLEEQKCLAQSEDINAMLNEQGRLYPRAFNVLQAFESLDPKPNLVDAAFADPMYCRNDVAWKKVSEQGKP